MKLKQERSHIYHTNQNQSIDDSIAQTTHLGIGAHQDDLEVMASHGIMNCYKQKHLWFGGVTCTDGAGSARSGLFANFTDEQMIEERKKEQILSAQMGDYSFVAQLGYPSKDIKNKINNNLADDIKSIIELSKPAFVYTHNLADKHDTHIAVAMATIAALRESRHKPQYFYGCEVWRTLDWMPDHKKVALEIVGDVSLIEKLVNCHQSQVAGGKRYDLATLGRMKSNATFYESHTVDHAQSLWFAMDLMPLIENKNLDPIDLVMKHIDEFKDDVKEKMGRFK